MRSPRRRDIADRILDLEEQVRRLRTRRTVGGAAQFNVLTLDLTPYLFTGADGTEPPENEASPGPHGAYWEVIETPRATMIEYPYTEDGAPQVYRHMHFEGVLRYHAREDDLGEDSRAGASGIVKRMPTALEPDADLRKFAMQGDGWSTVWTVPSLTTGTDGRPQQPLEWWDTFNNIFLGSVVIRDKRDYMGTFWWAGNPWGEEIGLWNLDGEIPVPFAPTSGATGDTIDDVDGPVPFFGGNAGRMSLVAVGDGNVVQWDNRFERPPRFLQPGAGGRYASLTLPDVPMVSPVTPHPVTLPVPAGYGSGDGKAQANWHVPFDLTEFARWGVFFYADSTNDRCLFWHWQVFDDSGTLKRKKVLTLIDETHEETVLFEDSTYHSMEAPIVMGPTGEMVPMTYFTSSLEVAAWRDSAGWLVVNTGPTEGSPFGGPHFTFLDPSVHTTLPQEDGVAHWAGPHMVGVGDLDGPVCYGFSRGSSMWDDKWFGLPADQTAITLNHMNFYVADWYF